MTIHHLPIRSQRAPLTAAEDLCGSYQPIPIRDPVRAALEAHVEACIALPDALDGNPESEDSADVENDPAEAGIGDLDGMWEQGHLAGRGLEARP